MLLTKSLIFPINKPGKTIILTLQLGGKHLPDCTYMNFNLTRFSAHGIGIRAN